MSFATNVPSNISSYDFSKSCSLTSLIIVKQQGQYGVYAMTVYGDSSYLKGDNSKLKNNTYRKKDSDFSGWVFYHKMDGTFINGWRYNNGAVTSAIYQHQSTATSTGPAIQSIKQVNKAQSCEEILVSEIWQTCSYYSWDTSGDYPFDCYIWEEPLYTYSVCFDVDDNGGGAAPAPPNPCQTTNAVQGKTVQGLKTNVVQPTDPSDPTDPNAPVPIDPNGEINPPSVCSDSVAEEAAQVTNNLKNPCLKSTLDRLLNADLRGQIGNILNNVFGQNDRINLDFEEKTNLAKPAQSDPPTKSGNTYNETIYLDPGQLQGASQELIATLMIHEIMHAYMNYQSPNYMTQLQQHQSMLDNYINDMANALQSVFTFSDPADAYCLVLNGMSDVYGVDPSPYYTKYNVTNTLVYYDYRSGDIGTKCN